MQRAAIKFLAFFFVSSSSANVPVGRESVAPSFRCGGLQVDDELYRHIASYPPFLSAKSPSLDSFVPFKIHFLLDPQLSPANKAAIDKATEYVQNRLSKIIRAPRLNDLRFGRIGSPNESECIRPCFDKDIASLIPADYRRPCSLEPAESPGVQSERLRQLKKDNYTLVVVVAVKGYGVGANVYCPDSSDQIEVVAHSIVCWLDYTRTNRATHGSVVLCREPRLIDEDIFHMTFLHELMHILMQDMYGSMDPANGCPYDWTYYPFDHPTERILNCTRLYEKVEQQWKDVNGSTVTKTRYFVASELVRRAAREHIGCENMPGAETAYTYASFPFDHQHWSERYFSDELMSPHFVSTGKLSNLTLAVLASTPSWYKIDFSQAEPLTFSKPTSEIACDIATKGCVEIVDEQRRKGAKSLAPFCEYLNKSERIITSHCSKDHKFALRCELREGCPVLNTRPAHGYDHAECSRTTDRDRGATRREDASIPQILGGDVGLETICITATDVAGFPHTTSAFCVAHECHRQNGNIVLKFRPMFGSTGMEHLVTCTRDQSKRLVASSLTDQLGVRNFSIICPDFAEVCRGDDGRTTPSGGRLSSLANDRFLVVVSCFLLILLMSL